MKTISKFIVASLGIGTAVLLLAGCHHLGGGCSYAPAGAPVATATAHVSAPPSVNSLPSVQPNAPTSTKVAAPAGVSVALLLSVTRFEAHEEGTSFFGAIIDPPILESLARLHRPGQSRSGWSPLQSNSLAPSWRVWPACVSRRCADSTATECLRDGARS